MDGLAARGHNPNPNGRGQQKLQTLRTGRSNEGWKSHAMVTGAGVRRIARFLTSKEPLSAMEHLW